MSEGKKVTRPFWVMTRLSAICMVKRKVQVGAEKATMPYRVAWYSDKSDYMPHFTWGESREDLD